MNTSITRKLPIGIQTFEDIRSNNYLYVDKTALAWRIANMGKPYFLSRPRRFGKSLLLSTFESYFNGRKDLFKGLAIEQLEHDWTIYPVLHLDLNAERYDAPEQLHAILSNYLTQWETIYGEGKDEITLSRRFAGVIQRAYEQTGRGVLKSADRYLRFVFLTGVTKFSQVSVFSDLNQLNDISMDFSYATLCGITPNELTAVFEPEIHQMAQRNQSTEEEIVNEMIRQYDGYHFHPDGEGVLNPFSVLNAFDKLEFGNYWFQTGTPTFLVELLKKSDYDLRLLIDGIEAPASSFTEYRMNTDNPIPLIYQSGYLTIKEYDKRFRNYILGFPNEEVKYGFLDFLLPFYTTLPSEERGFYIGKFVDELEKGNIDAFMTRLRAFFADFPYELNAQTERHYQVVFYLVFKLMGQFVDAEVRSATGRADAVVKTPKYIYVFEFKLDGSTEQALQQIDDRGYLIPYTADSRQLVKVGVNFNAEKRNIGEWKIKNE